jgi:SAM-dependent methyltransferase
MDLREYTKDATGRHPWELARIASLRKIVGDLPLGDTCSLLDVGCGDGFVLHELCKGQQFTRVVGVDIHLTEEQISAGPNDDGRITIVKNLGEVSQEPFDVVLMLDVLEHIEEDSAYLNALCDKRLRQSGYVMITVPAFGFLYSNHDRFLQHYRRYDLSQLRTLVQNAGLSCIRDGYLFGSLLPVRLLTSALEKRVPVLAPKRSGVGQWRGARWFTMLVEWYLRADNDILMSMQRRHIYLPGLTAWTLCQKQ